MTLTCPHCSNDVGEEPCSGCRQVVPSYECSRCHGVVPNPHYLYGLICMNCGKHVFEVPMDERKLLRNYLCQDCRGITPNFKYDSEAVKYSEDHGIRYGEACPACGEQLAVNPALLIKKCQKCGYIRNEDGSVPNLKQV